MMKSVFYKSRETFDTCTDYKTEPQCCEVGAIRRAGG